MKTCTVCKKAKSLENFYLVKGKYLARCRDCNKAACKEYKERNKASITEYNKEYRQANKIGYGEKGYRPHDPVKAKFYRDKTREESPEKLREYKARYRGGNSEKLKAHRAVHYAVKVGKLKRLPCKVCGELVSQGHHEDYSKPLEVIWLCRKHHSQLHGNKRREETA